jgi:prophage antirepressor-like protein
MEREKMDMLPILVKNSSGMELVEVDGQAVVTAKNLANSLNYKDERSILRIFNRNKASFKDYGVFDLTGVCQTDTSLRCGQIDHTLDTALVRFITPSASDGHGGGLQDVRVFTKRGALKVCMKSNQPKAVMVQDMLIDLYEKVESGQLIGAERFGRIFQNLVQEISSIKKDMALLKSQPPININLPDDTALPISLERRRGQKPKIRGAFKIPEVRNMCISLCRMGKTGEEILSAICKMWPNEPDKWPSSSALYRFWAKAKKGELKEIGIDVTVH